MATSWKGLWDILDFFKKSSGFIGFESFEMKGVSKKSGLSIQILNVESECPVTT